MGRSGSCFKIITCSGDDVDRDDFEALETKGSSDRRGWSFRKRSSGHQVLSNPVTIETPSHGVKETPESATANIQAPANSTVPEKASVLQWPDEKPQLITSVDIKVAEAVGPTQSVRKVDAELEVNNVDSLEESLVIAIQTAIRGILAQAELLKLKNLVKLQAAVRGHLVRRHAVGTLRCVQAIVKMQALVRARRARLSLEGAHIEENLVGDYGKDLRSLGKDQSVSKLNVRPASIEKLLSNGFARQLLESTPKTKPIRIKCDPSRPNSTWKWLERWMSNSSSKLAEPEEPVVDLEQEEQLDSQHCTDSVAAEELTGINPCSNKPAIPFEHEESLIIHDAEKFEFQAGHPISASESSNVKETSMERDLLFNRCTQSDGNSPTGLSSLSAKPAEKNEQSKRSMKRFASEQLENEGKKLVSGSRKVSSPAFTVAQPKFKDLSSTINSGKSTSSSCQVAGVETNSEPVSPGADAVSSTRELNLVKNSNPQNSRAQVGDSECDTELSVTSTLDSPEISESGALAYLHEPKVPEESVCDHNTADSVVSQDLPTKSEANSLNSLPVQPGKNDDVNGKVVQKPERGRSDLQVELRSDMGHQVYKSSPEASPRSHTTVPESHGTPASQVSVNAKRRKGEKSGSTSKSRSSAAVKKSPTNPSHEPGARGSAEQVPKDQKSGKNQISFGLAKAYNVDQEPGDSSSSNSLPSYMQPTKSARAKAHANSPRSSPDVQDKDIYAKKRHSLPGANGREGSPRIQRSMSQAQEGGKGNVSLSPHERKWQR